MKKKTGLILWCFLTFLSVFSFGINSAYAYTTCYSDDIKCRAVRMYYGQQQYAATGTAYFAKGETIYYAWDNDAPGIMQVGFRVYNSAGAPVSKELLAVKEGGNWGYWTVTSSGYYYLFASCEGDNDTRCEGGGLLKKW